MTTNALHCTVRIARFAGRRWHAGSVATSGSRLRREPLDYVCMRGRGKKPNDTERLRPCKGICKTYLFCCETLQHTRPSLPPNLASSLARKHKPPKSQPVCWSQQRLPAAEKNKKKKSKIGSHRLAAFAPPLSEQRPSGARDEGENFRRFLVGAAAGLRNIASPRPPHLCTPAGAYVP